MPKGSPTRHAIIEGYDPPEGWGWCHVDELFLDLGEDTTPQLGPIPRCVELTGGYPLCQATIDT